MEDHMGHRKYMYLATLIASVAYAGTGCVFSWTSPTLPRLMKPDSKLPLSEEQGSWVASIIAIGGTIGPLVSGKLLDNLGRKWTIILDALLLLASWAILGLATCVEMLYIGRFVAGFAVALLFTGGPMYISEISDDFARPMLTSSMELSLTVGFNIPYFAGPFLSYQQLTIVAAALPLIFILMFVWLPETPYYLIAKERKDEAIKSLQWFRGNISRDCAEKEIVIIESTMYQTMQKKESFWKLMKLSSNQKSMAITCFLMTGQQFSGINVLQVHAESIFMSSGTKLNPAYCAIIFGIFQFLSSALAAPLTKNFGFKKPLMVGSILIGIEHFVLGLYLYFLYTGKDVSSIDWLPLTCFILYIVTYSATYGPLPWGVLSEMFPTDVKAAATSVVVAVNFSTTFLVTKFFTNISIIFGIYVPFWIFTGFMIISFFFIQIVQPNTKGMSLQDIQDELNKKKTKPSINPS